jgi:hypothetical protein
VLRRLVDFDPQPLSPQIQALKAILERLVPQKPQPIPDTAKHRVNPPPRRAKAVDLLRGRISVQTPTQRGDRLRFQAPDGHRYASACCLGGSSSVASRVSNLLFCNSYINWLYATLATPGLLAITRNASLCVRRARIASLNVVDRLRQRVGAARGCRVDAGGVSGGDEWVVQLARLCQIAIPIPICLPAISGGKLAQ